jgi:esterase
MKLFYRKYGSGPPLIILHGLYGSSDNWATIAKNLSDKFTIYLPDQRNHGHSPHSFVHDYDSMSSDLHELATDLGLDKFFLAGHSMGGKTAIRFASTWPEMLLGLLIADISPFSNDYEKKIAYNFHKNILKAILETDLSTARSRIDIDGQLSAHINSKKIREMIIKNLQRTDSDRFIWKLNAPALMQNLNKIVEAYSISDNYPQQITGFPVTFLKGENSDYISTEDFRKILLMFPGAELIVVKNAGHWINADNPVAVTEALSDLLPF